MLDTSDPEHPKLLSVVDLGAGSGPHDIALTEDGKRLIVTDYFRLFTDLRAAIRRSETAHSHAPSGWDARWPTSA